MTKTKVLYLGHEYPLPATQGGQKGIWANSRELLPLIKSTGGQFIYVNVNVKNPEPLPKEFENRYTVVNGKHKGFFDNLDKLRNTFLSIYPRGFERTSVKQLFKTINELNPEFIIADGINFYPLIKKQYKKSKIIYIANNFETDLALDLAKLHKGFVSFCYYLQYLKMKFAEKDLFKIVDKIICISTSDYKTISKLQPEKTLLCPHNITPKFVENRIYSQSLLFAGSISFPPNRDAVRYICEELAEKIPDIKILITGTNKNDIPKKWLKNNIEFLGFVSNEKLEELYKTTGGFICPINFGSGIKIKILEALQYNMPIFATEKSLSGLKFIDIPAYIDINNIDKTVKNIETVLFDEQKYNSYSNDIKIKVQSYYNERRNKLLNLISSLIL